MHPDTDKPAESTAPIVLDYPSYFEHRGRLAGDYSDQRKFIDQTILALAGGTLGLTLTFLHDFVREPNAVVLLYLGDSLLVASIVLVLVSLQTSQTAILRLIESMDDAARASFSPDSVRFLHRKVINAPAGITAWLNFAASVTVVIGIALVSAFVYTNLVKSESGDHPVEKIATIPQDGSGFQRGQQPLKPAVAQQPPKPAGQQQQQQGK